MIQHYAQDDALRFVSDRCVVFSQTRIVSLEEAAHALLGTEEEAIKRMCAASPPPRS